MYIKSSVYFQGTILRFVDVLYFQCTYHFVASCCRRGAIGKSVKYRSESPNQLVVLYGTTSKYYLCATTRAVEGDEACTRRARTPLIAHITCAVLFYAHN
jgi:hypothetical protein